MAGQPKRKARQIATVLETADVIAARTWFARPDPETLRHDPPDALDKAWDRAVNATMQATIALEELGGLLALKAKLEKPVSLWTIGATPDATHKRLTSLALRAGVAPPSLPTVEDIHRRQEEERAAREREEEAWGEDDDEEWDDEEAEA